MCRERERLILKEVAAAPGRGGARVPKPKPE